MPRLRAPSLPQGRWRFRSGRRGGGRSRARISESGCEAGFHETFHGDAEKLVRELEGPPNRRRSRESPRDPSRQGDGERLRPQPRPGRGSSKRLRPWRRAPGERQGFRAAPRSDRDFERFRPRGVPRKAGRLRPNAFRKGDRRGFGLDASLGDGAASAGPDPTRGAGQDFGPAQATRRESARGFTAPPETHRVPNEASRPRSGTRGKRSGRSRPPRNPKAAQREMASPPSDGSQSWDKWGPVATPAPIMIQAPFWRILRLSFRRRDRLTF